MIRHDPVLLSESVEMLNIKEDGIYVDATYGGGGHSREILKRIKTGKLVAFDADPDVAAEVKQKDTNMIFINQNFRHLKRYLRLYNLLPVDGILADLGVSSHHLDTPERGFTYRTDAPLDMRMDRSLKYTAADLLNTYHEKELVTLFSQYGEIKNARTLARLIVAARAGCRIETSGQLREIIRPAIRGKESKYLSKLFQALRIAVNDELGALHELLHQSVEVLREKGRLAIITYHSLEDRMVKNFMKTGNIQGEVYKDAYGNTQVPLRMLTRKPITPSRQEIAANKRARSAKLRVAEKIAAVQDTSAQIPAGIEKLEG
ncbi:MAG: ribosomal RNA small subunit methyltransferase H [Chitinophagales bacterium]|nr:MAG: ribosomal RNA small subunit methyltransferase H [Chitinophagales bacterium]